MKKLSLFITLALLGISMTFNLKHTTETIVVNTGNFTITNSHDNQTIINTGGACTYTLSATTTNFVCNVLNNGTGNITLSTAVRVASDTTTTIISPNASEILPNQIGNKLKLHRDSGGIWRAI
jgi:hypothetical protein